MLAFSIFSGMQAAQTWPTHWIYKETLGSFCQNGSGRHFFTEKPSYIRDDVPYVGQDASGCRVDVPSVRHGNGH